METILKHAQGLVYALLHLMPSSYQHASLSSLLGLFLEAQGHPFPQHCQTKSASALSRFLNHYDWSTRSVLRTTRQAVLYQMAKHLPHSGSPLKVLIDLTTLPKCGKFLHLGNLNEPEETPKIKLTRSLCRSHQLHSIGSAASCHNARCPFNSAQWSSRHFNQPLENSRTLGRRLKWLRAKYASKPWRLTLK